MTEIRRGWGPQGQEGKVLTQACSSSTPKEHPVFVSPAKKFLIQEIFAFLQPQPDNLMMLDMLGHEYTTSESIRNSTKYFYISQFIH